MIIREKKGRVPCKKLSARKVTLLKLTNITRSVFTSYLSVTRVGIIEFCGTNCCRSAVCGFIRLVYIHLCQETIVFKNFQYFYISKFSHVLGKLFRERVTGNFHGHLLFFTGAQRVMVRPVHSVTPLFHITPYNLKLPTDSH